jgi:hypothetical protein
MGFPAQIEQFRAEIPQNRVSLASDTFLSRSAAQLPPTRRAASTLRYGGNAHPVIPNRKINETKSPGRCLRVTTEPLTESARAPAHHRGISYVPEMRLHRQED